MCPVHLRNQHLDKKLQNCIKQVIYNPTNKVFASSSVADPWHFGVDPDTDPDPAIFVIDLQDASKKLIF